jgi:heptosyltransferase-2
MSDRVLICGLNWLGDTLMSLPAVRAFRGAAPGREIAILAKPHLLPVWEMAGCASSLLHLERGMAGTWRTVSRIRRAGCRVAHVFPNSFRSALLPFLGLVPERVGLPGHQRVWMLTRVATVSPEAQRGHQSLEYFDILGVRPDPSGQTGCPLTVPPEAERSAAEPLVAWAGGAPLVAIIPGAARGPAKRWPERHFVQAGRELAAEGVRLVALGAPSEAELCGRVAGGIGASCLSMAGNTTLAQMAACLRRCRAAVTNDSGGMHMAAAAGTRVIAVFGLTDPAKTGPMGPGHAVLVAAGATGRRDVARNSRAAAAALESVGPERVVAAVRERL